MVIDGEEKPLTLFQLVKSTLPKDVPNNSIIAFHDNSSSIRGYECSTLDPSSVTKAGTVRIGKKTLHPILTAETHNFPSGVAPFPGAETGTGGRLRDVMATGRGAYPVAGVSSYCVGNLLIPGYELPWEDKSFVYPSNLASPLNIEIKASDGASDYGNKYGEPVVHGFTRSFGQRLPNGERFEWVKPIMFSAGVGQLDGRHTDKGTPEQGMLVVKVGGPAYRIGIGGGAASSRVQSSENAVLDFDAVQRGDAEMENRLNRLMRACCDLGPKNPIVSVHDQGAGGNGNVLKEIVEPSGAVYDIRKVRAWRMFNCVVGKVLANKRYPSCSRSTLVTKRCPFWKYGAQSTKRIMRFLSNRVTGKSLNRSLSVRIVLSASLAKLLEMVVWW